MKIKTENTKQMLPHLRHKLASERHNTKKLAYLCAKYKSCDKNLGFLIQKLSMLKFE